MKRLFVMFADDPQIADLVAEGDDAISYFEAAQMAKVIEGRTVNGMWIVDPDSEQEDVIAIYGSVPVDLAERFLIWEEKRQRKS